MKNILLPTDLTVQSLSPIHNIVNDAKGAKISIYVVHMLHLPTSITDLLFLKEINHNASVPENFAEALQMLRNKYQDAIKNIILKFVYCNTSRYFNNYLEGNEIYQVYLLDKYSYQQPLPDSVKFSSYINKCKVPLKKVPLQVEGYAEYHILSSLLSNNEHYQTT